MKSNLLIAATACIVGALLPAQAGEKEDVMNAIKKLSEKGSYSWTSSSKRPESAGGNNNRFGAGSTEGKTVDGMIYLKTTWGDRSFESVGKGDKSATKREDAWEINQPRPSAGEGGNDGQPRDRRRGPRGPMFANFKTPAMQAGELLEGIGELKKDGDVYTGELSEEAAKSLLGNFGMRNRGGDNGGDAPARPQPTGLKATAKFWVADGVLTKYESDLAGKISFNGNERDLGRTTTVEISEIGSTKLDVPEDIKKKLADEEKPAEPESEPAEEKKDAE